MSINEIQPVSLETGTKVVPPVFPEAVVSERWEEDEYHCFRDATGRFFGGVWMGEPGEMRMTQTFDEFAVVVSGSVALKDVDGERIFKAGDAFFVPRTFNGTWRTIEASHQVFAGFE
jgi:uncharacterized cupin superfamily protein